MAPRNYLCLMRVILQIRVLLTTKFRLYQGSQSSTRSSKAKKRWLYHKRVFIWQVKISSQCSSQIKPSIRPWTRKSFLTLTIKVLNLSKTQCFKTAILAFKTATSTVSHSPQLQKDLGIVLDWLTPTCKAHYLRKSYLNSQNFKIRT